MRTLIAVGLTVTWSAPAMACNFWFNSSYMRVPANPTISVGLQNWDNYRIISADVALKVGDKVVVRPGVGTCSYTGPGDSDSEILFGLGAAANLWNDESGKVAVNAQAGFEMVSFDGGNERNIPIGAAVQYRASDMVSLFGGAAVNFYNISYDERDVDGSSSDVTIFGGASYTTGNFTFTGGLTSWDGEVAINLGAGMALGSTMNGLRRIGSLFRK
jgi:hypothetical protein